MRYSRKALGEGLDKGGTAKISRNRIMEEGMSAAAWKRSYAAARAKQKGTTGIYDPKTGERVYGAHHKGPKKDMQGRRYRG